MGGRNRIDVLSRPRPLPPRMCPIQAVRSAAIATDPAMNQLALMRPVPKRRASRSEEENVRRSTPNAKRLLSPFLWRSTFSVQRLTFEPWDSSHQVHAVSLPEQ